MASCPRLHPTTLLQAGRSSLPQRSYAGGLFYFAATTFRKRNYSTLRQRKLESDAERCCGVVRRHSGGFYLGLCRLRGILSPPAPHDFAAGGPFFDAATKIGIGRGIVAATTLRRRNCYTMRRRKLESDAAPLRQRPLQAGHSTRRHDSTALILDFRPRLANRCSQEAKTRANRASILDFRPRLANRCSQKGQNRSNPSILKE